MESVQSSAKRLKFCEFTTDAKPQTTTVGEKAPYSAPGIPVQKGHRESTVGWPHECMQLSRRDLLIAISAVVFGIVCGILIGARLSSRAPAYPVASVPGVTGIPVTVTAPRPVITPVPTPVPYPVRTGYASKPFPVTAWVSPGRMAYDSYPTLYVKTKPGASCEADVVYSTGYASVSFPDSTYYTADSKGMMTFRWHEETIGNSGRAYVHCEQGTKTQTVRASFQVD